MSETPEQPRVDAVQPDLQEVAPSDTGAEVNVQADHVVVNAGGQPGPAAAVPAEAVPDEAKQE